MTRDVKRHTRSAAVVGIVWAFAAGACAPIKPPVGPGMNTALAAYDELFTRSCGFSGLDGRAVVTARVAVRGTSRGRPVRGRVWAGVDHIGQSLRLESADATPPHFVLTAAGASRPRTTTDGDATLYLPRRQMIVPRESSRVLLLAVLGLPLTTLEFIAALTGCPHVNGLTEERQYGPHMVSLSSRDLFSASLFFRRRSPQSPWTLDAMSRHISGRPFQWRAEYDRPLGPAGPVSRAVRIVGEEHVFENRRVFDVALALDRIRVAPLVHDGTFSPPAPSSARQVPLDSLQQQRAEPSLPLLTEAW